MADEAVSDERLAQVLGLYAGMVGRVLQNPGRWLGLDEDPPPSAGFPARELDAPDVDDDVGPVGRLTSGGRRAAATLWRLARALLETQHMLDRRPPRELSGPRPQGASRSICQRCWVGTQR